MFGFLFQKKRDEVRRLLSGRMNCRYFSQFRYGARHTPRGSFCEVVWVIPYGEDDDEPDFSLAYPVVTKDISNEGLSLIHDRVIPGPRLLIGLEGAVEMHFVLCEVEHCTSLGYGYFQIGVHPYEVIKLSTTRLAELQQCIGRYETERVAVAV